MKESHKLDGNDKKIFKTIPILFAVICLAMGLLCFQYYRNLQRTVKAEGEQYLQEISKQISVNVNKTINNNFSILDTVETVLRNANITSYTQLQPIVKEQQGYWNYQNIMLVDENGLAYDAFGNKVALRSDEYLTSVIVEKKRAMSTSQLIDGEDCIVFAIPVKDMVIDGVSIHALAASYDLKTFSSIVNMDAFNGNGYAHIIQRNGNIVVRSSSKKATPTGYNVLNSIGKADIASDKDIVKVKKEIANGSRGQIEFTLNGTSEFMVYEPLETLQWCLLTFVPTAIVSAKSSMLLNITLLLCGIITLSFSLLLVYILVSFYRHKKKLEQIAYIDPVTGGYTIQRFYNIAEEILRHKTTKQYALVYTNIEKFKLLNDKFGRQSCNSILMEMSTDIHSKLQENECIGRLSADNFCILIEYKGEEELLSRLDSWYLLSSQENEAATWISLVIDFGIYIINEELLIPNMVDRAKLALQGNSHELHGKYHYSFYNEKIRQQLLREKQLEDMMETSLAEREFKLYLQPKFDTQKEEICGAEALVRWVSKSEGMIYPDEFIMLFEKNGFVIKMDAMIFEEVCKTLRAWIDQGLDPYVVSVNCSRNHLMSPNFIKKYRDLVDKYNIPPKLIEIELTENLVFENVEFLIKMIDEIHNAGFSCSMDDFGSGYSSLNLIQEIPVDTLKIDKIFFHKEEKDLKRTKSVVGSIITMARELSMKTVAEGVEDINQVNMLKELGCDYIQGFYFAKPMPLRDFEKLAFDRYVYKDAVREDEED